MRINAAMNAGRDEQPPPPPELSEVLLLIGESVPGEFSKPSSCSFLL